MDPYGERPDPGAFDRFSNGPVASARKAVLAAVRRGPRSPRELEAEVGAVLGDRPARVALQDLMDEGAVELDDRLKVRLGSTMPTAEEADEILRAAGADPEEVGRNGAAFVLCLTDIRRVLKRAESLPPSYQRSVVGFFRSQSAFVRALTPEERIDPWRKRAERLADAARKGTAPFQADYPDERLSQLLYQRGLIRDALAEYDESTDDA